MYFKIRKYISDTQERGIRFLLLNFDNAFDFIFPNSWEKQNMTQKFIGKFIVKQKFKKAIPDNMMPRKCKWIENYYTINGILISPPEHWIVNEKNAVIEEIILVEEDEEIDIMLLSPSKKQRLD